MNLSHWQLATSSRIRGLPVFHLVSLEGSLTDSPKPNGPSDGSGWILRLFFIGASSTVY